jgi:hypothetical protein
VNPIRHLVENLTCTLEENLEEKLTIQHHKMQHELKCTLNAIVSKQRCVLGVLLAWCSDGVFVFIRD